MVVEVDGVILLFVLISTFSFLMDMTYILCASTVTTVGHGLSSTLSGADFKSPSGVEIFQWHLVCCREVLLLQGVPAEHSPHCCSLHIMSCTLH